MFFCCFLTCIGTYPKSYPGTMAVSNYRKRSVLHGTMSMLPLLFGVQAQNSLRVCTCVRSCVLGERAVHLSACRHSLEGIRSSHQSVHRVIWVQVDLRAFLVVHSDLRLAEFAPTAGSTRASDHRWSQLSMRSVSSFLKDLVPNEISREPSSTPLFQSGHVGYIFRGAEGRT